jgi:hypothetical protein
LGDGSRHVEDMLRMGAAPKEQPRCPGISHPEKEMDMTHAPRKSLKSHNSSNRFGVNEKPLPFSIRLGIVPHSDYLISQE